MPCRLSQRRRGVDDTLPRLPVGVIGRQETAVNGGLHRQRDPQCPWPDRPLSKTMSPAFSSRVHVLIRKWRRKPFTDRRAGF